MPDLLVLGAGPAGLGAAYRAARRGLDVVVAEREQRVGGLAGSFDIAGVRVDYGSHRLHPAIDPTILTELRGLLGDDLQRRRRHGRIRLGGRWLRFPLRLSDVARRLPPGFALGAAADTAVGWARRPRADTFAEQLRAGLGPTMCRRFYFPYARKLWGLEPEEISGEQARRRVRAARPSQLAKRVVSSGSGDSGTFFYPRRGYGQLWERLAEATASAGADIRLGTNVTGLRQTGDGFEIATDAGALSAPTVWSTIPVTALVGLLGEAAPADVRAAAEGLEHRAMRLVYLVAAGDRYTPFDAHYLPEGWTPVTRISEPKNYRDAGGSDPEEVTVLCAEIPCAVGDETWRLDDGAAGDVVRQALVACGLPDPPVLEVRSTRLPRAYPVYRLGFEDRFARVDEWLGAVPGLLTFGRQGLFAHDNAHHALAMAWAAADALDHSGRFDAAAWARARARFRTHVVED